MRTFEEIQADTRRAITHNDMDAIQRCINELDALATPLAEAEASNARGWTSLLRSDFPAALEQLHYAQGLYEQHNDTVGVARSLNGIGLVHKGIGEFPAAMSHFLGALALYQEVGDRGGMASAMANIGVVQMSIGEYPAALEHYHRALALQEELGNRNGVAGTTCNMGAVYMHTCEFPAALEHFHRALALCEELGNRTFAANIMANIGNVHLNTGDYPAALDHYNRAQSLFEELDNPNAMATAISSIGNVYRCTGDHAAALEHHRRAMALHEEQGSRSGVAISMDGILSAYVGLGSDVEAQEILQAMDAMQIDEPWVRIDRELQRATLQQRSGHVDDAIVTLQRSLAEALQHGLRQEAASAHKSLRDLALTQSNLAAYVEHNNEYARITEEINGRETTTKLAVQVKQREIDAREREHEKQLAVLHSTLPKEVAERVARGEVVNDHFENASVIFLDIVGFTDLSSSMTSQEVIALLDNIFTQCDAICAKHGVTKIKTIGDSYMAVSFDSVMNAAQCAVEMGRIQYTIQNTEFNPSMLQYRIGIHCGPVTAGVIGKERMQYDVWGDTVNVASRMESAGEPGKVHISEAFANSLKKMSDELQVTSDKSHFVSHSVSHEVSHSVSHEVSHSVSHEVSDVSHSVSHEVSDVSHSVSHNVPLVTRHLSLVTTPRGLIDIKGKGPMLTYWLEQR